MTTTVLSVDDYCVAIVCALDKALFAVRALFDQRHRGLPKPPQDPNHYALGQIGTNNIVAASLPVGEYGGNSASSVVTHFFAKLPFCPLLFTSGYWRRRAVPIARYSTRRCSGQPADWNISVCLTIRLGKDHARRVLRSNRIITEAAAGSADCCQ